MSLLRNSAEFVLPNSNSRQPCSDRPGRMLLRGRRRVPFSVTVSTSQYLLSQIPARNKIAITSLNFRELRLIGNFSIRGSGVIPQSSVKWQPEPLSPCRAYEIGRMLQRHQRFLPTSREILFAVLPYRFPSSLSCWWWHLITLPNPSAKVLSQDPVFQSSRRMMKLPLELSSECKFDFKELSFVVVCNRMVDYSLTMNKESGPWIVLPYYCHFVVWLPVHKSCVFCALNVFCISTTSCGDRYCFYWGYN